MKVVILAAGLGSRLRQGRSETPKPLTLLSNGQTIMERQVNYLGAQFSPDDIFSVVGYKMGLIVESFPQLTYVYNPDFSSTNTSKSLLAALCKIKGEGVLWLNGDVVFDRELLTEVFGLIEEDKSFVCVNNSSVAEEEVKYTLDEAGNILELNKSVKNGLGEAVGINYISSTSLEAFKKALEECEDQDYFEKGIEKIVSKGEVVLAADISKYFCTEVDFAEDLQAVNDFLG